LLASVSQDNTIRIWEAVSGKEERRAGPFNCPKAIAFSPDGSQLAIGDREGVWLWEYTKGQEPRRLARSAEIPYPPPVEKWVPPAKMEVTAIAWAADGRSVAWSDAVGTVKVREFQAKKARVASKGPEGLQALLGRIWGAVAFSPDGRTLAFAASDHSVRLWAIAVGKQKARLAGHEEDVAAVVFSPDGKTVATGAGGSVRLWEATTGKERRSLACPGVYAVAFSRDGKMIAAGAGDGLIRLWAWPSGNVIRNIQGQYTGIGSVAFSPDGKIIASGGEDEAVRLWDVVSGKEVGAPQGHTARVRSVAFSASGGTLASASGDGSVRLWDVATGKEVFACRGHNMPVRAVAISPDSRRLASAGDDGKVRMWDAATGKELATLKGHGQRVYVGTFCRGGTELASWGDPNTILLWKVATGEEVFHMTPEKGIWGLASLADGEGLAIAYPDGVAIWDPRTRKERKWIGQGRKGVTGVTCSPDGKWMAITYGGWEPHLRLYELASGRLVQEVPRDDDLTISCLTFAGRGDLLACGTADGRIRVWHVSTKKWVAEFKGDAGEVVSLAASPDGTLVAAGNADSTVLVWRVPDLPRGDGGTEGGNSRRRKGAVQP
jgi:WD40 repeat protein